MHDKRKYETKTQSEQNHTNTQKLTKIYKVAICFQYLTCPYLNYPGNNLQTKVNLYQAFC